MEVQRQSWWSIKHWRYGRDSDKGIRTFRTEESLCYSEIWRKTVSTNISTFIVIGWEVERFHTGILNFYENYNFTGGDWKNMWFEEKGELLKQHKEHKTNFFQINKSTVALRDHGLIVALVCLII